MTENRKRKFRRWATKGIPKGAPANEKRAFGAFITNRRKRIANRLGAFEAGKARDYETKKTRGKWTELAINRDLEDVTSDSFRRNVAAFATEFKRSHRGGVAFIRIKILANSNPYAADGVIDIVENAQEHWFGSLPFTDAEMARKAIDVICDDLAERVLPGNEFGRILTVHVYTVRNKRNVKRA